MDQILCKMSFIKYDLSLPKYQLAVYKYNVFRVKSNTVNESLCKCKLAFRL